VHSFSNQNVVWKFAMIRNTMAETLCECGKPRDPRAKTGKCMECYKQFRTQTVRPYNGGTQSKDSSGLTHYQRNKSYYLAKVKARKKRLLDFINDYKKSHPCVDCGNPDFRVLEFDHVTNDKEIDISQTISAGWSEVRILSEIEKCEVRCANCHKK
jgi:hypothetical protein